MLILILSQVGLQAYAAETFEGYTFYFGDLHAHTGVSPDGGSQEFGDCDDYAVCGYIADVFTDARDVYHLDFVSFTDHSVADPLLFDDLLRRGLDATTDTFVVIPGAERSLKWIDGIETTEHVGHKTALVFQDDSTLLATLDNSDFRGTTKRFNDCDEVWGAHENDLAVFGPALQYAHHPAAANIMTADWTCHNQTYQPVVEVYSNWGNSLRIDADFDPLEDPYEPGTVHEALGPAFGLRVGFVAGTDIHDTRPGAVCAIDSSYDDESGDRTHIYGGGLTVVALPEGGDFKRSTIHGELVARRSLVTTGPQIPVLVEWIATDGNGVATTHAIGEELRLHPNAAETTMLSVKVPADLAVYVTAVRAVGYDTTYDFEPPDVEGEWSYPFTNDLLPTWLYAEVEIDGAAFYVDPCVDDPTDDDLDEDGTADPPDDREFVWSSPTWFDYSSDIDGDMYAYDHPEYADCNDYDVGIHPDATEVWYDGIDQNCDGNDLDQDWDTFPIPDDCDDNDASVYPGAAEVPSDGIDQDCDGHDPDQDGDGYLFVNDCNDFDAAVNPGATELCGPDDVDDDCDGEIDDADNDTVPYDWYVDNDNDGYGPTGAMAVVTCEIISGWVTRNGDCNDSRARIHPGARDVPNNGTDENCDGRDARRPI